MLRAFVLPLRVRTALIVIALVLIGIPVVGAAPTGNEVAGGTAWTYQGQITTAAGPVEGACDIRAALYDRADGGLALGTGVQDSANVPVEGGLFTVLLDFGPSGFPGASRYLDLAVRCPAGQGDFVALTPRQPLTPAPYALTSQNTLALQGRPVGPDAPETGDVLAYDGAQWGPAPAATNAPGVRSVTAGTGIGGGGVGGDVTVQLAPSYQLPQTCQIGAIPAWDGTAWVCARVPLYTAGDGISISANGQIAIDPTVVQRRVVGACGDGFAVQRIAADGSVVCASIPSAGTTYTAGTGLNQTGTIFVVDPAYVQRRVAAQCPTGSSIRTIAQDGAVTCQVDTDTNSGGTVKGIDAGTGIIGGGDSDASGRVQMAADTTYLQRRVAEACPVGFAIRQVLTDGAVICDAGTATTAGLGLERTGAELRLMAGYQLPQTCTEGQRPRWDAGLERWECAADADTTYTAGTGLGVNGTTFMVDPSYVQRRVVGTCGIGFALREIAQDGAVTCEPVTPTAGAGVTTNGRQVSLLAGYQLPQTCTAGQRPGWNDVAKVWECAADANSGGTITGVAGANGSGLTGGGTSGAVTLGTDATVIQRRVTSSCTVGWSIRAINQDGSVVCQQDTNSGGDITDVVVGSGLTGGGASGAVGIGINPAIVQQRVASCAVGSSIRLVNQDGTVVCQVDANSGGTITGAYGTGGLTGGSANGVAYIAPDTAYLQRRVGSCAAGSSIRTVNQDGSVICEADDTSGGTITGVTAGSGLTGGGTSGNVSLALAGNILDIVARQGGNSGDWATGGVTNYSAPAAKMQIGAVNVTIPAGGSTVSVGVTFPQAFAQRPIMLMGTLAPDELGDPQALVFNLTTTGFTLNADGIPGTTYVVHWMAIGS